MGTSTDNANTVNKLFEKIVMSRKKVILSKLS